VATVDEDHAEWTRPQRCCGAAVRDERDSDVFEICARQSPTQLAQRVHAADVVIEQRGVVVLLTRLVLLGAAMVVDADQVRASGLCTGAEVHARLPAVRSDLQHWTEPAVLARELEQPHAFRFIQVAFAGARNIEPRRVHGVTV
jgi:hypothetical protein